MPFVAPHHRGIAAPSGIIRNGLQARWPMDEGSGTDIGDDSGNGWDGVASNTTWVSGIGSGPWSLEFAKHTLSNVLIGPFVPAVNNALSICARIHPSTVNNNTIIDNGYSQGNRTYRLAISNSANLYVLLGDSAGGWGKVWSADIIVPVDTVSHVGFTWDGATIRAYLNGTEQDTEPYADTLTQNGTEDCRIGNLSDLAITTWGFNGVLDDVRVYQRQLSQSEMQQISDGTG